jgi:hypothetical protein
MTQGEGFLSLNALSGQPRNKAIQLRALVKNQSLVILVDSGSSHTFLNARISDKLQVRATTIPSLSVRVINDEMLRCDAEVKNFEWWCQGNTFQVDAKIIDIGAYDLVLGIDWLEQFRPMMCDWLEKWIQFQYKGSIVRLQGIVPSLEQELKEVSMEQLLKWDKGNDLWATVLIEPTPQPSALTEQYIINGVSSQIVDLIREFDQIF